MTWSPGLGKIVNELEETAEIYKEMNSQFGEIISNTILFLENVRDSCYSFSKNLK